VRYRCPVSHNPYEEHPMKAYIDRFFGDIERVFDECWVVIWQLDDF
jgi:hypothetical protein